MSAPVAAGGFVYISTFSGIVAKLEQATGKFRYAIKARQPRPQSFTFSPAASSRCTTRGAAKRRATALRR